MEQVLTFYKIQAKSYVYFNQVKSILMLLLPLKQNSFQRFDK